MGEGFGRVDRIAKELAGPPKVVRRSTPARWAILGALAALGVLGALFYVGLSGKRKKIPMPEVASPASSAPEPAPAVVPLRPAGNDRALRAAQIAVVLDDVDANLHAVRLSWPGQKDSVVDWKWPDWMPLDRMNKELAELEAQLDTASDPVANATRAWIAMARTDGPRLHELVGLWNKPDSSVDDIAAEVRPMFDRMVVASQAVHAAVAADLVAPAHATLAAVGTACRIAPMLARLPLVGAAAPRPAAERGGSASPSPSLPRQPEATFDEMRATSLACIDEARAYLADYPTDRLDYHVTYQFGLATQTANNLLGEIGRRRDALEGRVYVSSTSNLAHESSYLAAQRREHDPSLRPVPAEAPAPE